MANIDELIGELYEVAAGSDDWSPFVERLAEAFDAPYTALRARSRSSVLATTVASAIESRYVAAYEDYFHLFDPVKERLTQLAPGTTVVMPDVALDPTLSGGEYYQDFLRPMGCAHLFGIWSSHDEDGFVGFGLGRSAAQPSFTSDELCRLATIGSHLSRASRLRVRLGQPDPTGSAPGQLMERFGLTPKEAEVAAEIVRGNSVTGIGSVLGIGRETVRFHLRSIFQKTHTHSQAQLVSRMLLSGQKH